MRERTLLEDRLGSLAKIQRDLDDAVTLVELGEMEGDSDAEMEGVNLLKGLQAEGERRQLEALLSGEADGNDTYVEVHSGAGGTESCDWARMLLRMYMRWAERREFEVELAEETAGDEAGIKSATLIIKGHNAHGWMKTESGVHRLVRISPFDSNARRHTSFASVWVYPVVDDRFVAIRLFDDLDVETAPLGPAHIHAQQHARPVAALCAAGAGMDFDIGVVAVRLARQQRLELAALALGLQCLEEIDAFLLGRRIPLHFAEFDKRHGVVKLALDFGERTDPVFQHRAFAHQLLRGFGVVPEIGIFGFGVQFRETARSGLYVKDASSAVPWTA